jgi:hypothetical protein
MAHNSFAEFERIVKGRIDGKSGKANPKEYSVDGIRKITRELRRIRRNQGIESKRIGKQIANSNWNQDYDNE